MCRDLLALDGATLRIHVGPTSASSATPLVRHKGVLQASLLDQTEAPTAMRLRIGVHTTIHLTADEHDGTWRTRTSFLIHTLGTEIQIFHPPPS